MPRTLLYHCDNPGCAEGGVEVSDDGPAPITCTCGGPIDRTVYSVIGKSDDDGDFYVKKQKESRPGWFKGRRSELEDRQRSRSREASKDKKKKRKHRIYCAICDKPINVDDDGKESWKSKSGKKHSSYPHIDHYGSKAISTKITGGVPGVKGDWAERLATLRSNKFHQDKSPDTRWEIERRVYNASPLRVAHMKCNCSRPKYKGD